MFIGYNFTIYHQFTIAYCGGVFGDNVLHGAGCKIMQGFDIGSVSKVGANCVVVEDIPQNATVVSPKTRIIIRNKF